MVNKATFEEILLDKSLIIVFVYLNKRNQLTKNQPNIDKSNIGCCRQLLHHAEDGVSFVLLVSQYSNLMKRVVVTSITERFTVTAASK